MLRARGPTMCCCRPNHPAAGSAATACQLVISRCCRGLPEPGRSA
jgi:hypothetical protein